jgi:hypothetical protein
MPNNNIEQTPKGVVAVLVGPDGRELANAADFSRGAPAGFSPLQYQESQARRALALAAVAGLSSPEMAGAVDTYLAEQIMRAMCNQGCRVMTLPVGHDKGDA